MKPILLLLLLVACKAPTDAPPADRFAVRAVIQTQIHPITGICSADWRAVASDSGSPAPRQVTYALAVGETVLRGTFAGHSPRVAGVSVELNTGMWPDSLTWLFTAAGYQTSGSAAVPDCGP